MTTPRDLITIENARILWPNFMGTPDRFNQKGDREFNVELPEELAAQMDRDGFNVKRRNPMKDTPDEVGAPFVKVKVSYKIRAPRIYMVTSKNKSLLSEELVGTLDSVDIVNADMTLSPHPWSNPRGESGLSLYVRSMYVVIFEDDLDRKYAEIPDAVY